MADQPPAARPPIRAEIAGNRLEVIESGDARLKLLLELIGGARHSIKMLMHMCKAGRVGNRSRDALAAAAGGVCGGHLLIPVFRCGAVASSFATLEWTG